jgi:hypothetical protein
MEGLGPGLCVACTLSVPSCPRLWGCTWAGQWAETGSKGSVPGSREIKHFANRIRQVRYYVLVSLDPATLHPLLPATPFPWTHQAPPNHSTLHCTLQHPLAPHHTTQFHAAAGIRSQQPFNHLSAWASTQGDGWSNLAAGGSNAAMIRCATARCVCLQSCPPARCYPLCARRHSVQQCPRPAPPTHPVISRLLGDVIDDSGIPSRNHAPPAARSQVASPANAGTDRAHAGLCWTGNGFHSRNPEGFRDLVTVWNMPYLPPGSRVEGSVTPEPIVLRRRPQHRWHSVDSLGQAPPALASVTVLRRVPALIFELMSPLAWPFYLYTMCTRLKGPGSLMRSQPEPIPSFTTPIT